MSTGVGWRVRALSALLAAVGLAVTGAAVGLAAHGPAGSLIGAALGALAGVFAGFVPVFHDRAEARGEKLAAIQAAWIAVAERRALRHEVSLAELLRPDLAVVDFVGRAAELAALRDWSGSAQARSIRVVVGAGGVGKTRLAQKI